MTYKDFPLYNIILDPEAEEEGLSVISIVDHPAVEQPLFCFSADEKKKLMFIDETKEQHCITSVALLADTPIYRYSPDMGEYYVVFEKQTIRDLVEKYAKDGYNNLVSFNHDGQNVEGFIMIESFFVDKERGINPTQFKDLPDGSWCVTYKCTNDELWETVKNTDLNGYSVEINCTIEPAKEGQEIYEEPEPMFDDEEDYDADFDWLAELIKMLEDADCEVLFENQKKKSEDVNEDASEDDDEDDGLWSLNFAEVERADVASQIKKAVKIDGKTYWIYGVGKDNGTDVAIVYDPDKKGYEVKPIKNIKKWEPIKEKPGDFPVLPPDIVNNDDISVQKTINSGSYSDLIHNRIITIINYNDEQQPATFTGARQCCIIAWGLSEANNEVIRVYEAFGASRSAASGENYIPNFRLLRTDRIISMKPMYGTEPYGREMLDSRTNFEGDKSMRPCYEHIMESDFI